MAAHSLNPAVNIARYLHADQSPPAGGGEGGWKLHYIEGVSRSRGEGASGPECGGQGSVRVRLGSRFPVNTFARASERAGARSPYIISLSSTLYMRSRSIFCLFAPLNASHPV